MIQRKSKVQKNPKQNSTSTMRSNFEVEDSSKEEQVPFTTVPSGGGGGEDDDEEKPDRQDEDAAAATTTATNTTTIEIDPVILEAITKYAKPVPHPQYPDDDTRMMLQVSPGVLVSFPLSYVSQGIEMVVVVYDILCVFALLCFSS